MAFVPDSRIIRRLRSAARAGSARVPIRRMPLGWAGDLALIAGFVAVTVALAARTPLLALDVAVADWCDAHRPATAGAIARGLNYLGQGGPLTVIAFVLAGWRTLATHSVRPLLVPVTALALTYCSVGPLKVLFARAAPHYTDIAHPELLFAVPSKMSYPSGHVVNALVWYAAITILVGGLLAPRVRWALRVVPVGIVVATTTYLAYHWITDGIAAVLIGLVLTRVLLRIRWDESWLGGRLARTGWTGPGGLDPDPRGGAARDDDAARR